MEIPAKEAAALFKLVEERRRRKAPGSPRPSPMRKGEGGGAVGNPAAPRSRHKKRLRRPAPVGGRNKARSRTRQPLLSPSSAASAPLLLHSVAPDAPALANDAATEKQLSWTLASLRQLEQAETDQQERNAAYVIERNKVRDSPVGRSGVCAWSAHAPSVQKNENVSVLWHHRSLV